MGFAGWSINGGHGIIAQESGTREIRNGAGLDGQRERRGMREIAAGGLRRKVELAGGGVSGSAKDDGDGLSGVDRKRAGGVRSDTLGKTVERDLQGAGETIERIDSEHYGGAGIALRQIEGGDGKSDRKIRLWRRRLGPTPRATSAACRENQRSTKKKSRNEHASVHLLGHGETGRARGGTPA